STAKVFFFFQAEDGIRDGHVTGVQTCALPISDSRRHGSSRRATACWCFRDPTARRARRPSPSACSRASPPPTAPAPSPRSPRRRSEERRVGKECRSRWSTYDEKKKE